MVETATLTAAQSHPPHAPIWPPHLPCKDTTHLIINTPGEQRSLSHFVFPEQPAGLPFLPPNYMPFARPLEGFPDSSVGKESACQCRRPQFNSWIRKIHRRRDRLPTPVFLGFPCGSAGKESVRNAGDLGSIPGLGRCPGEGKGYPLQNFGLENSMDYTVLLFLLYTLLGTFHPLSQLQISCPYWWSTNPCLQFNSLHWAPDLDILQESQLQHTHNGIVSFSLCSYYGNKSIHLVARDRDDFPWIMSINIPTQVISTPTSPVL